MGWFSPLMGKGDPQTWLPGGPSQEGCCVMEQKRVLQKILYNCSVFLHSCCCAPGRGKHSSDDDHQQLWWSQRHIQSHQPLPQRIPADASKFPISHREWDSCHWRGNVINYQYIFHMPSENTHCSYENDRVTAGTSSFILLLLNILS